ncbi:MAG: ABC transporter permease [Actinobacteria bacterium]|nr:ABC transporter permease [Actinomycetota bacterium]
MTAASANAGWHAVPRRKLIPARWRNPIGLVGAAIVSLCILTAVLGRFIWTNDPNDPISNRLEAPSWAHPFGTDDLGRDTLARIIHGSQVSLEVGLVAISIALVVGTLIGLLAGYFGGFLDLALMRIIDILFAFPGLVLAIVIAGLLGASRRNAMLAIGVIIIPAFARVVRAAVLEVMGFPFIESARALGGGHLRIMLRHVLPNVIAPLIVLTTLYFSTAILTEAALSFLGLGTQPPEAAWGNMLQTARSYIDQSIWMSIFPGLAIMVVVLGFNFLGDGLRDVLDPRVGGGVGDVATKK